MVCGSSEMEHSNLIGGYFCMVIMPGYTDSVREDPQHAIFFIIGTQE